MKRIIMITAAVILILTAGCSRVVKMPEFPEVYSYYAENENYKFKISPEKLLIIPDGIETAPIEVSYSSRTVNFGNIGIDLDTKTEKLLYIGELIGNIFKGNADKVEKTENEFIFYGKYLNAEYVFTVSRHDLEPQKLVWGEITVDFTEETE